MSRVEAIVPESSHDRPILQCGKCRAVLEYDRGVRWCVVNELANEHWEACPMKPHGKLPHMARTATSPLDTEIASLPPASPEQYRCPYKNADSVVSPSISPGCERKRRTLEQRKQALEEDEYTENVTAKSVFCKGCLKVISLDKRSEYYPGLWVKHKKKCSGIDKHERAKARIPPVTRASTGHIVVAAAGNPGYGDVHQGCAIECYQSRDVAAACQSARHYDSDDSLSEDEDEDGDLPSHEPFPTQNCAFYWTQQPNEEWAYRYATRDEITTNLFHGQNEPYPRSRPFTYPLATSRCVIEKHGLVARPLRVNGGTRRTG